METIRWSVAQIWSKRAHRICEELTQNGRGTFQPVYRRSWFTDGKLSQKPSALMPGYLFFEVNGEPLGEIEGVLRVLPSIVPDAEFNRLWFGSKLGAFDAIEQRPTDKRSRVRRRRPRPGKRARMAAREPGATHDARC